MLGARVPHIFGCTENACETAVELPHLSLVAPLPGRANAETSGSSRRTDVRSKERDVMDRPDNEPTQQELDELADSENAKTLEEIDLPEDLKAELLRELDSFKES